MKKTEKVSAEQLAQHIADEWGPLETVERVKMIVEVRGMIEQAVKLAEREAYGRGHGEAYPNVIEMGDAESFKTGYKAGYTAGAEAMRGACAAHLENRKQDTGARGSGIVGEVEVMSRISEALLCVAEELAGLPLPSDTTGGKEQ